MICFQAVDVDGILSSREIAVNIVPQNVPVIIGHCLKVKKITKIE
jgi:hypothetical protein